jgi:hypothetical protein
MSAVFEAVGDLVEGVADAVGDAVEWVGDTVSNVVEAALDDPVKAALQIGVIAATGGAGAGFFGLSAPLTAMQASVGLAAIEGVDVLEEGGDIDDAFKAAATSFAVSQAVSFGMDAFNAAGPTDLTGSATTQFFDDGSSIQFFDDGSRLVTDAAGAVNPVPAPDELIGQAAATEAAESMAAGEVLPAGIQPSGAETFPIPDAAAPTVTELPPVGAEAAGTVPAEVISPENVPLVEASAPMAEVAPPVAAAPELMPPPAAVAQPTYETMEELLLDKGLITPEQAAAAVAPPAMTPDALPDSFGDAVAVDPNAVAIDPTKQYETMEDLMYDKGLITDAQYKELTGVAPVVDLSTPAGPMSDTTLLEGAKDLGGAVLDYAIDNPLQTLGIVGAGAALAGAGAEEPQAPGAPAKKTYTYGAAPEINRSGLQELWSAASKIYGNEGNVMKQLGIEAPAAPTFQSSFQPLLSGQAPGAGKVGLGALGQGFSYTPMGQAKTFDISTLTPEQIVQLQDMVARKKQPGEGA